MTTRKLTTAALLLALCVVAQQFKMLSQFVTGPIVNAILIISALGVGVYAGLAIAFLSPLFVFIIAPPPILQAVPQMIPLMMTGNAIIVVIAYLFRNRNLIFGLIIGSLTKAGWLWAGVSLAVIPMFGSALVPPQVAMLSAMFSYNQLITALAGSLIAVIILRKTNIFSK